MVDLIINADVTREPEISELVQYLSGSCDVILVHTAELPSDHL